jgi:hypothetical protein
MWEVAQCCGWISDKIRSLPSSLGILNRGGVVTRGGRSPSMLRKLNVAPQTLNTQRRFLPPSTLPNPSFILTSQSPNTSSKHHGRRTLRALQRPSKFPEAHRRRQNAAAGPISQPPVSSAGRSRIGLPQVRIASFLTRYRGLDLRRMRMQASWILSSTPFKPATQLLQPRNPTSSNTIPILSMRRHHHILRSICSSRNLLLSWRAGQQISSV